MRWIALLLLLPYIASAAACGGDNGDSPSDTTPIRGTKRLAWNQQAASRAELNSFSFHLYVGGVSLLLVAGGCDHGTTANGYDCSGSLPSLSAGSHVLQL